MVIFRYQGQGGVGFLDRVPFGQLDVCKRQMRVLMVSVVTIAVAMVTMLVVRIGGVVVTMSRAVVVVGAVRAIIGAMQRAMVVAFSLRAVSISIRARMAQLGLCRLILVHDPVEQGLCSFQVFRHDDDFGRGFGEIRVGETRNGGKGNRRLKKQAQRVQMWSLERYEGYRKRFSVVKTVERVVRGTLYPRWVEVRW